MEIPTASDASPRPPLGVAVRLFSLGFVTLFLELTLIRYLGGTVWNLSYFPNMVLLAVFVGLGTGFILHGLVPENRSPALVHAAVLAVLGLIAFVKLGSPVVPGFNKQQAELAGELFFTSAEADQSGSVWQLLVVFLLVAVIFAFIAQATAKAFSQFRPLTAYTLDIGGSICGILAFMLMSWLTLPAAVWFGVCAVALVPGMPGRPLTRGLVLLPGLACALLVNAWDIDHKAIDDPAADPEVIWSPYQKLTYINTEANPYTVFANKIWHQRMYDSADLDRSVYMKPYQDRRERQKKRQYRRVLILGAGSGNDVAAALKAGAEHVTAVEIDPAIAALGSRHPAAPYKDPRVRLVINDGRAFLRQTREQYDLIVFALTDSLVKVSAMAQLRLENYLFTVEAARRAWQRLSSDGDLVFCNYYRKRWLYAKIRGLAISGSGRLPTTIHRHHDFVMLKVGQGSPVVSPKQVTALEDRLPSDDWPFLYLQKRGIPGIYLGMMVMMVLGLALFGAVVHIRAQRRGESASSWQLKAAFLAMGAAFLLLETKSVIQFSLLFGTTWLNNSLVFLAVLVLVLAVYSISASAPGIPIRLVILFLLLTALIPLVYPIGNLLAVESGLARFVLASLLTFAPLFFANLLFSLIFRDQKVAEHLFGWNLMGATLGGVLEYSSLALGYNLLAVLVVVIYLAAFGLFTMKPRPTS